MDMIHIYLLTTPRLRLCTHPNLRFPFCSYFLWKNYPA